MENVTEQEQTPQKGGGALAVISLGVAIYLIYLAVSNLF
jgi:flagellar basal body-associated protein FliL